MYDGYDLYDRYDAFVSISILLCFLFKKSKHISPKAESYLTEEPRIGKPLNLCLMVLLLNHVFSLITGKSSLLCALECRELPIPEHIDIYHLRREMEPNDKTALQCVIEVDKEKMMLERESEILAARDDHGIIIFVPKVNFELRIKHNGFCFQFK